MIHEDDDEQTLAREVAPANQGNSAGPPEITLDLQGRRTVLVVSNRSTTYKIIQSTLQKDQIKTVAISADRAPICSKIKKRTFSPLLRNDDIAIYALQRVITQKLCIH